MYGDQKKNLKKKNFEKKKNLIFFLIIFLKHSGQNDPDYVKFLQAWFAWLNH